MLQALGKLYVTSSLGAVFIPEKFGFRFRRFKPRLSVPVQAMGPSQLEVLSFRLPLRETDRSIRQVEANRRPVFDHPQGREVLRF